MNIYLKLLCVAFFWGGTWPVGRVIAQEVPVFTSAFLRFFISSIAFLIILKPKLSQFKALALKQHLQLLALGGIGVFVYTYCFLSGLKYLPASEAALVIPLNPVIIALASACLGEKQLSAKNWLGIAIAFVGSVIVISKGDIEQLFKSGLSLGHLLIFSCVICWAVFTLLAKRVTQYCSSAFANFYAGLIGAVLLGICMWQESPISVIEHASLKAWLCIVYLALLGTVLSYTWFTEGVKAIGSAKAAAFVYLVPLFGVLLSALFLQEALYLSMMIGGSTIMLGVLLIQKTTPSASNATLQNAQNTNNTNTTTNNLTEPRL